MSKGMGAVAGLLIGSLLAGAEEAAVDRVKIGELEGEELAKAERINELIEESLAMLKRAKKLQEERETLRRDINRLLDERFSIPKAVDVAFRTDNFQVLMDRDDAEKLRLPFTELSKGEREDGHAAT